MEGPIFESKHIDGRFIIDIKIYKVRADKFHPEGIKYSLVVIDKETGKRLLGFDNHENKGHHMHILKNEKKYDFADEWRLVEDFNDECIKLQ